VKVGGFTSSEPPPVPLPPVGELVGDDDGDAEAVGEDEGEALGDAEVVLGEGLGEAVAPLQATPLRVKAVGAVLVPL
jgi:hypothetical protein